MKKILLIAIIAVAGITACNKNQKVVKQLDGTWFVTAVTVGGSDIEFGFTPMDSTPDFTGMYSYEFKKCKLKKDTCTGAMYGSIRDSSAGQLIGRGYPFTYDIDGKGGTMNITVNFTDSTETTAAATILEQSKSIFEIELTTAAGTTIITMEKKGVKKEEEQTAEE